MGFLMICLTLLIDMTPRRIISWTKMNGPLMTISFIYSEEQRTWWGKRISISIVVLLVHIFVHRGDLNIFQGYFQVRMRVLKDFHFLTDNLLTQRI
jgi:hypothetical protein